MKFLSIFCHTISTHTYRQPHALPSPTVNFSSLDEKTEERRRIRKTDARERPILRSPIRSLEDRHFCRRDTVQASIDVVAEWRGRGPPLPPLLQMCSSFLKPLCPIAHFSSSRFSFSPFVLPFQSIFVFSFHLSFWIYSILFYLLYPRVI